MAYDGVECQTIDLGMDSDFLVDCVQSALGDERLSCLPLRIYLLSWRYNSMYTHLSITEGPRVLMGFPGALIA